jgi:hypothetical protein
MALPTPEEQMHREEYIRILKELDPDQLSTGQRRLLSVLKQEEIRQRRLRIAGEAAKRVSVSDLPSFDNFLQPTRLQTLWSRSVLPVVETEARESCERLSTTISNSRDEMTRYSSELKKVQARMQRTEPLIARLRHQKANVVEEDGEHHEVFISELNRIRQLPGVDGVVFDPLNNSFKVSVKPRVRYQGSTYDFGDWVIDVFLSDGYPRVACGRVALKRFGGVETLRGSFCLGRRANVVERFVQRFEILEALALVIEAMHGLNVYHDQDYGIPEYFPICNDPATMKAISA